MHASCKAPLSTRHREHLKPPESPKLAMISISLRYQIPVISRVKLAHVYHIHVNIVCLTSDLVKRRVFDTASGVAQASHGSIV